MEEISYEDFTKLDIRVAKVVSAQNIPGRTRIMQGVIDLGGETRTVVIGGAQYYTPEEMTGRTVIVLANLEHRKVAGIESQAMLLAADADEKPFWLDVSSEVPMGSRIR